MHSAGVGFRRCVVVWLSIGYIMLLMAGCIWFICFPLTAYTLYKANEFPLAYFGVFTASDPGFNYWMPQEMREPIAGLCLGFALYGLFVIYFNVRNLRRLRLGEKPKSRFADADAAMGITGFDKRDGTE